MCCIYLNISLFEEVCRSEVVTPLHCFVSPALASCFHVQIRAASICFIRTCADSWCLDALPSPRKLTQSLHVSSVSHAADSLLEVAVENRVWG